MGKRESRVSDVLGDDVCSGAAEGNHLEILKWEGGPRTGTS